MARIRCVRASDAFEMCVSEAWMNEKPFPGWSFASPNAIGAAAFASRQNAPTAR
jgi:hypothetical protein